MSFYENFAMWNPPTNVLMGTFLTIDNSNRLLSSLHVIKGLPNELSIAFQADEQTGIYSASEGVINFVSLGHNCGRITNAEFTISNRYGGSITLSLGPKETGQRTFNFPSNSDTLVGEKFFSLEKNNGEASTIEKGMVVKIGDPGEFLLAEADSLTNLGLGVLTEDVLTGDPAVAIFRGKIYKDDWTTVTGSATLTEGTRYYLSDTTPGLLTATPPTITQYIGVALDANNLLINI